MDESDGLVWGAANIAKEIGKSTRGTYHLLHHGALPATKVMEQWVGQRKQLRNPACWPRRRRQA